MSWFPSGLDAHWNQINVAESMSLSSLCLPPSGDFEKSLPFLPGADLEPRHQLLEARVGAQRVEVAVVLQSPAGRETFAHRELERSQRLVAPAGPRVSAGLVDERAGAHLLNLRRVLARIDGRGE